MKSVEFLQRMIPYAPGDVAGFEDQAADRMIELGIAKPYEARPMESPATRDMKSKKTLSLRG